MKKLIGACAFLAGMLICSVSFAQDDTKMQTLSFEEDYIEGDLMLPSTDWNNGHRVDVMNLIKTRDDFAVEIRKTVFEL